MVADVADRDPRARRAAGPSDTRADPLGGARYKGDLARQVAVGWAALAPSITAVDVK